MDKKNFTGALKKSASKSNPHKELIESILHEIRLMSADANGAYDHWIEKIEKDLAKLEG